MDRSVNTMVAPLSQALRSPKPAIRIVPWRSHATIPSCGVFVDRSGTEDDFNLMEPG